jgi:eukaryotic-like serine/threonine-protein kinase
MAMASDVVSPVSVGDLIDAKYRVDQVLGAGGMGVVVAATHLTIQQRVAIKFLRPGAHPKAGDYVARFIREARSLARLRSEHVARVYDAGQTADGTPYIVMELLEGRDLAAVLEKTPKPPIADAVEYILQACEALLEAHEAGIVHRDLKPHNLFVGRTLSGAVHVKLLDFGIAKDIGGASGDMKVLTDSSVVLGSPLYMAPEQMRGAKDVDKRTDVWSLGVILHQMLAGALPFDSDTVPELCVKVLTEAPPVVSSLNARVPPELSAIVTRCLQKDVALRFRNMAELAAALEPFSRSAERGIHDRPWRSLVDTLDNDLASSQVGNTPVAQGANAVPVNVAPSAQARSLRSSSAALSVALTESGAVAHATQLSVGAAPLAPMSKRTQRRRPFYGGVATGVAFAIAIGCATYFAIWLNHSRMSGVVVAEPAIAAGSAPLDVSVVGRPGTATAPLPTSASAPAPTPSVSPSVSPAVSAAAPRTSGTPRSAPPASASARAPAPSATTTAMPLGSSAASAAPVPSVARGSNNAAILAP